MEKTMSNTSNTPKLTELEDHRPLTDSELDAVTGGTIPGLSNMIADQVGDMLDMAIKWW
jgi:hypothetical protein